MEIGINKLGFLLYAQENGGVCGAIVICKEGYMPAKDGIKIYLNGGSDFNIILNRVEKSGGKIKFN